MPDLTQPNLQIFFTGLSTVFQDTLLKTPKIWAPMIASTLPSDTELETYGWADLVPSFKEWVGPRQLNNVPTRSRSLVNKDWEDSIQVPLRKFQDDKHGLYASMQTRGLARQAAKLDDQQLKKLIQSNPVGFDGDTANGGNSTPFFSASGTNPGHLTNLDDASSAVQFNDFPTAAFTPSNYSAARAAMRGFVARDGNPFYAEPNVVAYPPQLDEAVLNVLNSDFIAPALFGGQTQVGANDNKNNLKGTATPVLLHEFNNQGKVWYVLDTTGPVMPFVVQKRQDFNMVYITDPTHPYIFEKKQLVFGADTRRAYDVTMWWYAVRNGSGL